MADWRTWVCGSVGPGAEVARARRLHGGVTSVVHAVDVVDRTGRRHRLVLRRYPAGGVIEAEPQLVELEVRALQALETADIAGVPRLVAFDEDGRRVGSPAVLSTRLPGRPVLAGMDEDRWIDGLAEGVGRNLAALASVPVAGLSEYRPWHEVGPDAAAVPPAWVRDPSGWSRAVAPAMAEPLPSGAARQAIHRDSNPGNLLWQRGRVTGVVDWVHLCHGPVEDDIARCRVNVWLLAGRRAADRFLRAVEFAGLPYDRLWDLSLLADLGHYLDEVAAAARRLGAPLTAAEVRQRAEEIARSGL